MTYAEKLLLPQWKSKRAEILERDNHECQICGERNSILNVHHKYYRKGHEPWQYPNSALITYCLSCHKIEERKRSEQNQELINAIYDAGFLINDVRKFTEAFSYIKVKSNETLESETSVISICRAISNAGKNYLASEIERSFNNIDNY